MVMTAWTGFWLVLLAASIVAFALAVACERNFHPLGNLSARFRGLPIWKQWAAMGLACALWAYGGTKPSGGGHQPPALAAAHQSDAIVATSGNPSCATAIPTRTTHSLTAADLARGFVMTRIGSGETYDFAPPPDATIVSDWRAFGAANDWIYAAFTNWTFKVATNDVSRLRIYSFGKVEPMIREVNGAIATNNWFAPFIASLGVVPQANWNLLNESDRPSQVWYVITSENSLFLTWQNALLDRDTAKPISFQIEFKPDGQFIYRYDLSRLNADSVTNILAGASFAGNTWTTNSLPTNVTSMAFYPLSADDASDPDLDSDGLATIDELFVYGTDPHLRDTDFDGLTDYEEVVRGFNPVVRDSDNDGLVDGADPDPISATSLDDLDGDGIPDAYESHWFGDTNVVDSTDAFGANGFNVGFELASGINPTIAAESPVIATNRIAAWKITDGFFAQNASASSNIYERTFHIARNGGWEQFFLSSRPDRAGAWRLDGLALEWEDAEGEAGTATASPARDSLYLPVSTNSPASLTIRLRQTAPAMSCRTPLYLLAYSPHVEIEDALRITTSNGAWTVVEIKEATAVAVSIDRMERPCKAALYPQESAAAMSIDDGKFLLQAGGTLQVNAPGVCRLPTIELASYAQGVPRSRSLRAIPLSSSTNNPYLAFFDPKVSYGTGHHADGSGLYYDAISGTYSETCDYPLDSGCLWRSFHSDAAGGYVCRCSPALSLGFDFDAYADITTNIVVNGETATGMIAIGGETIWTGTATHAVSTAGGGSSETKLLSDDGCDDCGGCEDGNCDSLEGADLGSLKFRIPLGIPRDGQVSGFAWFLAKEPLTIGVDTLQVLSRADAQVSDTTVGGRRTIVCSDNRGRTLDIVSIENGIRVTITETASGSLEHAWELTNINGSPSQIRLRKISRQNNTMSDETYTYDDGDWTKFDNISQTSETIVVTGDINADGFKREERIVRDAQGAVLSHTITESHRFGSFANAVLRQTYYAERSWGEDNWNESFASYYTDNDNPKRNGNVRLEQGNARAWRFCAYDTGGRAILTLDQHNGSECPQKVLLSLAASAFDDADVLAWFQAQSFTAIATIYGYAPLAGDDTVAVDADKVRTESRYLVSGGTVTLIGRKWTRYTHGAANGYATVTVKTITAGAQDAAIDDARNAVATETRYDEDAAGVPLVLCGEVVSSSDADGITITHEHSIAAGVLTTTERKSKGGIEAPVRSLSERCAIYGNVLRAWNIHTASGIAFDEKRYLYDEKNRLRSTIYSDGSFSTNAYSCCRLLWSQDRAGRKVLRSAITGEDHLYYATEEPSLGYVSSYGKFRITQHFMDALGRETNTVVYAGTTPGEATSASASEGKEFSTTITSYPYGSSDYAINTDERGAVRVRRVDHLGNCIETGESVFTNGVEVFRTKSQTFFGGGCSMRREWDNGKWSMTRHITDYAPDGKRIEYTITESFDCGIVTNSVSCYDLLGRLVSTTVPGANGSAIVTVNSYDGASSRLLSSSTTGWPAVTYSYNERGERVGTSQDGKTIRNNTTYETIDQQIYRVSSSARMTGNVTNSVQVRKERLSGLSDALRSRTISVSASGIETIRETSFDANSCILTSVSQVGSATPVTEWSIFGMVREQVSIDGLNGMAYDDFGRTIAIAMSDSTGATYRVDFLDYDHSGNLVRKNTDFLDGRIAETTSEYDMLNREVKRTDAMGNQIEMTYDPLGRMLSVGGDAYPILSGFDSTGRKTHGFTTRDNGVTWDETQWEFDPACGVNTAKQYADGSRIAYAYTDSGKKTCTMWARGAWKENAYNERNLVSGTTYSGTATPSVAYTYTDCGKTVSATLSDGTSYAYGYDNRLLNTNESVTVGSESFSVNQTYDGFRRARETAVVVTNVRYAIKTRLYDSENRVCGYALTNAAGRGVSVSLVYDGSYLMNIDYALSGGGRFAARLSRDTGRRNLVTRRDYFFGDESIYWYSTEYDLLNRPTNATDSVSLAREWRYNHRSELVGATLGSGRYGYAYDSIGNRLWSSVNAVTNAYAANRLNQYSSLLRGSVTPCEIMYDADGNLTNDGRFVYAYDAENRLVSVYPVNPVQGSLAVENRYDHRNRRIRKIVKRYNASNWQINETHTFVWDGNNIVFEQVAFANGLSRTFEYFWGADKSGTEQGAGGVEGLLAISMDGVFYIPCYDHNGNIVLYVSETGSIAAQYVYDPYGNVIDTNGHLAAVFSFGFSTKHHDRETGMVGYQRRFYRPDLGRWLNRDPLEEEGGENLYAFCQNNAIFYYDPNGESFEGISNFCAGVGDSLTFGLTRLLRRGLNRVIEGTWDDPADVDSTAYFAGEATEVTVEIAVTIGGATLRHTAKATSRVAVEGGARSAYRRAHGLVGKGGEVHHINPIKGHPHGPPARYPLPYKWAARGEWNLTWYATKAEHNAAHTRMQMLEAIDKYRQSTLLTRQSINVIINHLNSGEVTKCWDSLVVRTDIYYYEFENFGVTQNTVPEMVTIQIQ